MNLRFAFASSYQSLRINKLLVALLWLCVLHLKLTALPDDDDVKEISPAPKCPPAEASDAEWNSWSIKHAAWFREQDYLQVRALSSNSAKQLEERSSNYDWRLEARLRGLSSQQIQRLAANGVVVTGGDFATDSKPEKPMDGVFVTSDMILHAYAMMVSDLVRGIEMQRAPRLRRSLEIIWNEIQQAPGAAGPHGEVVNAALLQIERVVGTALMCLNSRVTFRDAEVERECRVQMQLIMSASSIDLPAWLSPGSDGFVGIDYKRMKPVGIYTENTTLTGLFRATRWLQAVPFRSQRDHELVAFSILAEHAESSGLIQYESMERQWLGLPNCLTLSDAGNLIDLTKAALMNPSSSMNLDDSRRMLVKRLPVFQANDDLRLKRDQAGIDSVPFTLKILPSYVTADAWLFSEILSASDSGPLPDGRMITAFLGDATSLVELDRVGLGTTGREIVGRALAQRQDAWSSRDNIATSSTPYSERTTFNSMWLHALSALFSPPAEGAPPFMSGPAWRAKSRNTALSSWAEKKHTWILHEVEPSGYLAGSPPPPPSGLIEPNPEFFHRMWGLAVKNVEWMEQSHFLSTGLLSDAERWSAQENLKAARLISELGLNAKTNSDRRISLDQFCAKFSASGVLPSYFPNDDQWEKFSSADFEHLRQSALLSAEAILQGLDPNSDLPAVQNAPVYRRERWSVFIKCVKDLETLSRKQLKEEAWNKDEREYLTLGVWDDYYRIVYLGDSGLRPDPRSLGPQIASVASNPNSGLVLQVGTGQQSEIYVLYPWKGVSYLFRGLIIPYYEMSSTERFDDSEWRALLKSDHPPVQPEWLAPLWN